MNYTPHQQEQLQSTAFLLFAFATTIAIACLLAGCETFKGKVPNSCVIDATSYQLAAQAQDGADKAIWSRLLFAELAGRRHCYLIFKTVAGGFYAWDIKGSDRLWKIKTMKQANNPKIVAKSINPAINWAEYETTDTDTKYGK